MSFVTQTTDTNCFAACLASILGCSIESVPTGADGSTWDMCEVQNWLANEFGLQALEITFGSGGTIYPMSRPITCIVTGKSPRGEKQHAVVAETKGLEGFSLIHDPHPSGLFIEDDPLFATFFVPLEISDVLMSTEKEQQER